MKTPEQTHENDPTIDSRIQDDSEAYFVAHGVRMIMDHALHHEKKAQSSRDKADQLRKNGAYVMASLQDVRMGYHLDVAKQRRGQAEFRVPGLEEQYKEKHKKNS